MEHLNSHILKQLTNTAKSLACAQRQKLESLKKEHAQLSRPDFIWHYLLQSFATMGRASGWHGLIGNKQNYDRLRFEALERFGPAARAEVVEQTCRAAKIRMPGIKAKYILGCFEEVRSLGGLASAKHTLMACRGSEAKIAFWKSFPGIGDKYARNIMMDVYHEDFRDSIAVDARIKTLSQALGLSFPSYADHEAFYLRVASAAGLNGWELDRLIFHFTPDFLSAVAR